MLMNAGGDFLRCWLAYHGVIMAPAMQHGYSFPLLLYAEILLGLPGG
jgi:hypothetical protein